MIHKKKLSIDKLTVNLNKYMEGLICGSCEAFYGKKYTILEISVSKNKHIYRAVPAKKSPFEEKYQEMIKYLDTKKLQKAEFGLREIIRTPTKKEINFENGKLILWGIEGFSLPIDNFILFINELRKENKINDLKRMGYFYAQSILKNKKINLSNLQKELELLEHIGVGKIIPVKITEKTVICKLKNPVISKHYLKIFGPQQNNIDSFICGICEYIYELIYNKKTIIEEKKCSAIGTSKYCLFSN